MTYLRWLLFVIGLMIALWFIEPNRTAIKYTDPGSIARILNDPPSSLVGGGISN